MSSALVEKIQKEYELKGEIKGEIKGKLESARSFKNEGISVDIIAKCTGLSKEEIEKI